MNVNVYLKELKRGRISFVIWCFSLSSLIFLGMAFYPVLTENNMIETMSPLFENPMMGGLMAAFGVDFKNMTNVLGFFVAYNSIYALLIGCVFSIMCGSSIVAREEYEKTAEFLLTRPVTRSEVLASKYAAFLTQVVVLSLVFFLSGIVGMELFKSEDGKLLFMSKKTEQELVAACKQDPAQFRDTFKLNEDMVVEYLLRHAFGAIDTNSKEFQEYDLDISILAEMVEEAAGNPEGLLEKVRKNPAEYMELFKVPESRKKEFLEELDKTERELAALKQGLRDDPANYLILLESSPGDFFAGFITSEKVMLRVADDFSLPRSMAADSFIYYRFKVYAILNLYCFLLLLLMGSIGFFVALLFSRGRTITGVSMGIVFGSYVIDAFSKVAPGADWAGYISPFKFVDRFVQNPAYDLEWWRVLYFAGISALLIAASFIIYRRKDILL